ncbi:type I restriction enzyme HsdR N-terminal domain-containing protein [Actinophytocola sp.]|uniref:type I restriction enzyme HsdR N-terminal domain-containing protein n=1 Tax=Actinophytocola sp. TaxID=1872138 RepID=UPI002D805578|nr:type I restriction enzyme HsdR N-terminal domain-containing protein [Actinophytocola sp.]HET9142336.1 type I restriction enzyme HsdR N-terminal domain-containing protein [Actinophytocola sp.]
MDIAERAQALALKIRKHKGTIETEEATKNAFVMPFISTVLGYDVFNPTEVIPEFTADVGLKRGEKIDYAIAHDGQVQLLVEVKKINDPLRIEHASQLFRYFSVTNARIAILTNGEVYHFSTDLDVPNRMDAKPFLVLDFSDIDETLLPELGKLTRESFDLDSVISAAGELKYIGQLKRVLAAQFKQPEDEWVRFLTTRVYDGSFTQRIRDQFLPLVLKAAGQFLNEQVNDRLKNALGGPDSFVSVTSGSVSGQDLNVVPADAGADSTGNADDAKGDVVTLEEEVEGFRIVRAIVCSEVAAARVVARDTKSYFGILLDDNNRRPIARLWFNRTKKYLGLFDEQKAETRIPIAGVEDIYQHADQLRRTVARYLGNATHADAPVQSDPVPSDLAAVATHAP